MKIINGAVFTLCGDYCKGKKAGFSTQGKFGFF